MTASASLGTIATGLTYTLQVYAGAVFDGTPAASSIVLQLLANGTPLIPTTSNLSNPLTSSYQQFTETYDLAALAGHVGQSLTISFGTPSGATGHQTNFDDVTLTATTPEPATALLLVVAVPLLGGCALRRRRSARAAEQC